MTSDTPGNDVTHTHAKRQSAQIRSSVGGLECVSPSLQKNGGQDGGEFTAM